MIPIILSGGSGSRLWPLSRTAFPKQFLAFSSKYTLFQETCLRLPSNKTKKPLIICNNEHRFIAAHQLQDINIEADAIILEPVGRNTAPAIAMAAMYIEAQGGEETMLILPSDHIITDTKNFHTTIEQGEKKAREGKIVTFGIVPTKPHTGYGYIQASTSDKSGAKVLEFKEKPDALTAEKYLKNGNYYWNSGMFMISSSVYLSELEKNAPDILKVCRTAFENLSSDLDFLRISNDIFEECRSESIDYAIMEKTDDAYVIPLNAGWNDLGEWSSIFDTKEKCIDGNVAEGDISHFDCKGSYFYSDNKLVTAIGLDNMIVVDTVDALLIAPKSRSQEVKAIVNSLNKTGRSETITNRMVHRPWGTFDSVDKGDQYQVKRITVYPGQKLSVQKHQKRSEHWVVVKGIASITLNDEKFDLEEYESTYIPVGSIHSLENKTDTFLKIIEVQCGRYLGEDDIIRLDDIYGRQKESI
ncbi:MAG: mannose-1-phosphate guanylyltransferase/mannose-6-phosphate isomerase [Emcibacteraceae bacterium]|nr:mannose-1-phosphate guanylyltransferase/mannose-6-phosphate isomerase [Emcibacteraceae bacterium]MDG1857830.1 mannose-1-phosphate guanylyltransferase/mannose-6-phosphate isomerase [Emcibacteraceae bacterium]